MPFDRQNRRRKNMEKITLHLKKDKETKGTRRFAGEIDGRGISIYLPKERVPADVESVSVTIK